MSDARSSSKIHYIALAVVLGLAVILAIVGTATPQFTAEKSETIFTGFGYATVTLKAKITLWKAEACVTPPGVCKSEDVGESQFFKNCDGATEFSAAQYSCIVSIILGVMTVLVILRVLLSGQFSAGLMCSLLAVGVFALPLLVAPIVVAVIYNQKLCPGASAKSFKDGGFDLGLGFFSLVAACGLTILAIVGFVIARRSAASSISTQPLMYGAHGV